MKQIQMRDGRWCIVGSCWQARARANGTDTGVGENCNRRLDDGTPIWRGGDEIQLLSIRAPTRFACAVDRNLPHSRAHWKRTDIDLILTRFARIISEPLSIRGELALALIGGCAHQLDGLCARFSGLDRHAPATQGDWMPWQINSASASARFLLTWRMKARLRPPSRKPRFPSEQRTRLASRVPFHSVHLIAGQYTSWIPSAARNAGWRRTPGRVRVGHLAISTETNWNGIEKHR